MADENEHQLYLMGYIPDEIGKIIEVATMMGTSPIELGRAISNLKRKENSPHLVYFDGSLKDFHQDMFNDILKSVKSVTEIDRLGWNKFLGIRWAIGPKTLILLGDKPLLFPFFEIIKFWIRESYFLRRMKNAV